MIMIAGVAVAVFLISEISGELLSKACICTVKQDIGWYDAGYGGRFDSSTRC